MSEVQHPTAATASHREPTAGEFAVVHVMRTYGTHGGERQLAQYFSATPIGEVLEHFVFLYRDDACSTLFRDKGANLIQHNLLSWSIAPRQNPWLEILLTITFLPFTQIRLLFLLLRLEPRVCVVHGVQAAIAAWLAGMVLRRRIAFMYVHRTTKRTGQAKLLHFLYVPYRVIAGVSKSATDSLRDLSSTAEFIALENGVNVINLEKQSCAGKQKHKAHRDVIIAVGRLLPSKRQALLIESTADLVHTNHDVELWIVGDGPDRNSLEAEAGRLGVSRHVVFWGQRHDVPELLGAATVFANASAWEGLSNAVLEAMATGLPSVVVDAPGVSECHVNGRTGYIVAPDAGAIASAIARLLDHTDLRAELGAAAKERAFRVYSVEANRRRFLSVYRRLAKVC